MRKVILSMESNEKYEIIKRLAEDHISKPYAAVKIGCTLRHVNRLLKNISWKESLPLFMGILHASPYTPFLNRRY